MNVDSFGIHFFICNLVIAFIVIILCGARRLLSNYLSNRTRYHLWFIMLLLLTVPFLPIKLPELSNIFSWLTRMPYGELDLMTSSSMETLPISLESAILNDFSISISRKIPSAITSFLVAIWILGMLLLIGKSIKSKLSLDQIKQSALPVQHEKILQLYTQCNRELNLKKHIPIYSSAFLKTPVMMGFFSPGIYLPIYTISNYNPTDMRYVLLHELQHYIHRDSVINFLMNLSGIVYWFNPFIWFALKEMRIDREIACDTAVLELLTEKEYEAYGNTLINFAEKLSLSSFPFVTGLSTNMKQMKHRILNIVSYQPLTPGKKIKSTLIFIFIALLLFSLAPVLSGSASTNNYFDFNKANQNIIYTDLSHYFEGYQGSFVLYDLGKHAWTIYNEDYALQRISPNSTFKIYSALFGLEEGIITPANSQMTWNQEEYPFESWNANQDLHTAMENSVNWYFQAIDAKLGYDNVQKQIQKIGYGNQDISGGLFNYWMESSLLVSPVEQVNLMKNFYNNTLEFAPENINMVKESIYLSSFGNYALYGKTGTGKIDHQDQNGWFVGFIEGLDNTYFFATNIQADTAANGSIASSISLSILSDLDLWK